MDREGRFNFWGMLLHTGAVTPPSAGGWIHITKHRLPGWLVLSAVMALAIGVALYASDLSKAPLPVSQANVISVAAPIKASRPW